MSPIDALLTRTLLLDDPHVPQDVVPPQEPEPSPPPDTASDAADQNQNQDQVRASAASDLQTLCEVLVAATPASALRAFVTEQLPGPAGALALGCIVQMTNADDSARFWWQYAAGAGDQAAAYCLHLHHLSLGERDAATWWWQQAAALDTCPTQHSRPHPSSRPRPGPRAQELILLGLPDTDASTPTLLRVLRILSHWPGRPRTEAVNALLHYVPTAVAVGYLNDEPDIDLPMPGPDFADQIGILLAATSTITKTARPPRRHTTPRLPGRPEQPRTSADRIHHGHTGEHPADEDSRGPHCTQVGPS